MSLVRIVKLTFKTEAIEAFRQLFEARKNDIRNFAGCTHLQLWQDRVHPNIFFTYSHWNDTEALDAYRHSEMFNDIWQQTKIHFAVKPEAWSVNTIDVLS